MEKEVLVIFLVFTIGSCLSSFFMVFVYRLPRHESLGGRSHCENCGQTLSPYQLIPIWSFFLLKGQCSRCAIPINPLYPASELIGGILLVILYVFLGGGE